MATKSLNIIFQWIREPLFHFFAAGACIYLAFYAIADPQEEADERTVIVAAGEVEWLATAWKKRWNRPPTQQELDGILEQHVKETILYREALNMGLDKDDVVIRRRLSQKVEFLTFDLLQPPTPTDEELGTYFRENISNYTTEPRATITQIFFDPDRRGNSTLDDAKAAKTKLSEISGTPTNVDHFGDEFLLQSYFPDKSLSEISREFGSGFAEPVFELEPGKWHGPVLSGFGTHLVYLHSRTDATEPPLDAVREKVVSNWTDFKRKEQNDEFLKKLVEQYTVIIEPVPNLEIQAGGS